MRRRAFGRALVLLTAVLSTAGAAGPQASKPAAAGAAVPFASGETLRYEISWRIFKAGEASIRVENHKSSDGPPYWQATVNANSTGFVSKLYKVEDKYVSRFDNGAMCSQFIHKTVHEGRRHRSIRIDFHRDRKLAVLKETDLANNQFLRQAEHPIPGCVYDVVSALFYVRSQPLEVGKSLQVHINDGAQTLPIYVEVQAKEEVKTDAGTFRTIRVEPKVFDGSLFRRSGRMWIWISDDPQRMLIQLKAKVFVGTITAALQGVDNK